jgi:hypothetical protein
MIVLSDQRSVQVSGAEQPATPTCHNSVDPEPRPFPSCREDAFDFGKLQTLRLGAKDHKKGDQKAESAVHACLRTFALDSKRSFVHEASMLEGLSEKYVGCSCTLWFEQGTSESCS